jgi:hypothetical protein
VSDRRRDAEATLARLGIDAAALERGEVGEDGLLPLLAGAEAKALAGALGELSSPAVAALLVALEGRMPDRRTRKEIRLALYRLKQRGVAIPEPPAPAAPKPQPGPVAEGLVSHFDGRGDRLLWITRPGTSGVSLLITAQVNEPAGIRDVHAGEMSRKQLRTVRERLEKTSELRLVRADWRVLDALLVEGHERAGGGKREIDYQRLRPRLTTDEAAPPSEPVSTRVALPAAAEHVAVAAEAAKLLELPEFRTWWPDPAAAAPFVQEMGAVRASPLLVSRAAQQERLVEILRRAAVTLIPPAVLARRLDGMAYVLAETGRGALARHALATAALLRARPEEAIAVPFVAAYVERALGGMMAEDVSREQEERRGSLVVTPAEFLKDRSSSHPRRTRG